jgi:hypothetical protein
MMSALSFLLRLRTYPAAGVHGVCSPQILQTDRLRSLGREVRVPWSSDRLRDNTRYYTTADEDYKNRMSFEICPAGRAPVCFWRKTVL